MRLSFAVFAAALMAAAAPAVAATEAGTWQIRLRAVEVIPDVSSTVSIGGSVSATNSVIPEVDATYFITPNWAVELIAGTTKHSIYYNKTTYLGSAWLLPPTLTVQYHLDPIGAFQPYVGAGPNFTLFYDKSVGALGKLRLTDQWGVALQAGTDIAIADGYYLNLDVKKLLLSTHASFSGAPVTANVDINPWLIGAGVGVRF